MKPSEAMILAVAIFAIGPLHDLVTRPCHATLSIIKICSWYKIDARNGKILMKLVRRSILRPLTFECVILERFESLKNVRELRAVFRTNLC